MEANLTRTINLIHPGEILLEEFLKPMNISQHFLAMEIHVPAPRINAIVLGKRSMTADTALRLGQYFKTGPEFWMNLQSNYEIGIARSKLMKDIASLIPVH